MARINAKGVVISGLLAGLIINISEAILNMPVLGAATKAALKDRNLPEVGGGGIGIFIVGAFVLGIALVWLYTAIRPRFGPGPKTAIVAGVVVWFLAYLVPGVEIGIMGLFPPKLLAIAAVWGLAEVVLAALAGARFYTEA